MKLLTAGVGDQPEDFAWGVPGELVHLDQVCDRDRQADRDHGCGCGRAFSGLATGLATTVAVVAELDIDRAGLVALVHDRYPADTADRFVTQMVTLAEAFPVGTRLRRWLDAVGIDV